MAQGQCAAAAHRLQRACKLAEAQTHGAHQQLELPLLPLDAGLIAQLRRLQRADFGLAAGRGLKRRYRK